MSAIAGILTAEPESEQILDSTLNTMLESQTHRGPDGSHSVVTRSCAIGHCAHFTSDLARTEQQPIKLESNGCSIVADLRLDNRQELLGLLGLQQHHTDSKYSDCRLALEAYLKWGDTFAKRLTGDFAIAIWNPAQNTLLLIRDHFGVKPVIYTCYRNKFYFASEVDAIVSIEPAAFLVCEDRIMDTVVHELEGANSNKTFYKNVYRLKPGHTLKVARNLVLTESRYWRLEEPAPLQLTSDIEYQNAFKEQLNRAVFRRLQGVTKPGAMLSGGLDSSSVVAAAVDNQQPGAAQLKTYSGLFEFALNSQNGKAADDGDIRFIQEAVTRLKTDTTYLRPTSQYIGRAMEAVLAGKDSIFEGCASLNALLYYTAKKDGVNVVLDGLLGDELLEVSSNEFVIEHFRSMNFTRLYQYLYNVDRSQASRLTLLKTIAKEFAKLFIPGTVQSRRIDRRLRAEFLNEAADAGLLDNVELYCSIAERAMDVRSDLRKVQGVTRSQVAWLNHCLITAALERYDRAASRFSIEARHPFIDKDLVQFCMSLPLDQKNRNGWSRWILRKSMESSLPSSVVWRPKGQHPGLGFNHAVRRVPDIPRMGPVATKLFDPAKLVKLKEYDDALSYANADFVSKRQQIFTTLKWLENHDV